MNTLVIILLVHCLYFSCSYQLANITPNIFNAMVTMQRRYRRASPSIRLQMVIPMPRPRTGDSRKPTVPPPPINFNIKADPIRLIAPKFGENGEVGEEMLGIYSLDEALGKADEMELDLVMINEKGDPPVCKIIDYGKFKYSMEKKKKENMKKQVKGGLKEVKMSYKIDVHDFDVRVRAAQRFIAAGDRVRKLHCTNAQIDSTYTV